MVSVSACHAVVVGLFPGQVPVSKRILRQIVDVAQCKVNGATSMICRKIIFETGPWSHRRESNGMQALEFGSAA